MTDEVQSCVVLVLPGMSDYLDRAVTHKGLLLMISLLLAVQGVNLPLLALFVVVIFIAWYLIPKRHKAAKSSWMALAKAHRWRHTDNTSTVGEIFATIDGVAVSARAKTVSQGKIVLTITQISAPLQGATSLSIELKDEGVGSFLEKLMGAQDVLVGDEAFDRKFQVQSDNPALCQLWLDNRAREIISQLAPYRFALRDGAVLLSRATVEMDPERLHSAIKSAALLARQGEHLAEVWSSLSTSIQAKKEGQPIFAGFELKRLSVSRNGVKITLSLEIDETGQLRTLLSSDRAGQPRELALEIPVKGSGQFHGYDTYGDDEAASSLFCGEVLDALLRVRPAFLSSSSSAILLALRGFVVEPATIEGALALVASLSVASSGPYR